MRRRTIVCLAAVTGLLAGCTQPAVTPKPQSFQDSENTVRDWESVAHQIASEMALRGLVPAYVQTDAAPEAAPPPRPVFVRVRPPDSTFLREVADAFEADVLRRGGTIARLPFGATVVNLDVDVVALTRAAYPEAVWKATVEADDRLIMKLVEPVYIHEQDIALYWKPVYPPLEARLIRYDP